jgi:hypothetical protein
MNFEQIFVLVIGIPVVLLGIVAICAMICNEINWCKYYRDKKLGKNPEIPKFM